ncbi:cysteine dioxygenase [Fodinicurvata fenggangensis]|uniref:cysteine dioxygenase family protein n=1 Tax=Fodinicurvata fenggangensis TaxID=1121830 RepID=UPI00047E58A9|nr:cysteine dioxygenase [Fodinicurvata fenggangensis]
MTDTGGVARLRTFIKALTNRANAEGDTDSEAFVNFCRSQLVDLISSDDWLPEEFAAAHPEHYQQYLLHCDPLERFSLISFVWGPGQKTPVHNHGTWGLIGMLRGSEISQGYEVSEQEPGLVPTRHEVLNPGDIAYVSPEAGDIHEVINSFDDRVSISIHLYGANIGLVERSVYEPASGRSRPFVSGYASSRTPNIWGLSV